MTHSILKREFNIKPDNRTTAEKKAAKALGVELKNAATDVRAVYHAHQWYAQVWWTACGNNLIISADNDKIDAALCTGDFDWDADVANDERNYFAISEAAGLLERGYEPSDFETNDM